MQPFCQVTLDTCVCLDENKTVISGLKVGLTEHSVTIDTFRWLIFVHALQYADRLNFVHGLCSLYVIHV